MSKNNEMIEYKENIITKIKNIFKSLFHKNAKQYDDLDEKKEEQEIKCSETQDRFFEEIKIDSNETYAITDKKRFLEEIDGNIEMLNMLSVDRLRKLEKYYDDVIKENEEKIKKLKKA